MSTGRQLPARDYLTLKAALRDLVEAAGGGARAAGHCRAGASLLSRYGAVQEEMQAPIDVIADLEAQVGDLVVTRALAALHGCVVVPDPALAVGAPDMARHLGRVARETGEVLAGIGAALADDGKVCAREAAALVPEVREATEALVQLGHDLDRIVTGAVVPLRPERGVA